MADRLSGAGVAVARAPEGSAELEKLPVLLGKLGDEVVQLLETKVNLLKVEVREEAGLYARDGAVVGVGATVATVGFALSNVAVAFFVSLLFPFSRPVDYALGFLVTGVAYVIIGAIIVIAMKKRIGSRAALPNKSLDELRKDKAWLSNNI